MVTSPDNERLPPIYCSSEWHLRENPRAFMIYSLALRLTEGGENEFYLSQAQLARYFNWDVKTVRVAFRAVCDEGLFKLLRSGRGGNGLPEFASVYRVIRHSQLQAPQRCWPHANVGTGTPWEKLPCPPGKTWSNPLGKTGTLVSDQSPTKSSSPSQGAPAPHDSASPHQINPNPSPQREIPADFQPDESNVRYARKHGLDLKEEVAAFSDLHGAIGNQRSKWQAVFRNHLKQAALICGRDRASSRQGY